MNSEKKSVTRGLALPDIRTYYKVTVTIISMELNKLRNTEHIQKVRRRIKYIYNLVYDKGGNWMWGKRWIIP